jgi:hypothetical protein
MRLTSAILTSVVSFIGCSVSRQPTQQSGHNLAIDGASIKYDGKILAIAEDVHVWFTILGQPSRTDPEYHLYTWDDLRLYVRTHFKFTAQVEEFGIVFEEQAPSEYYTYWPKHPFTGRLAMDGGVVARGLPMGHVKKKPPKFKEGPSPITYCYSLKGTKPPIYVSSRVHGDGTPFYISMTDDTSY